MWWKYAYVGQNVVCVELPAGMHGPESEMPVVGAEYFIIGFEESILFFLTEGVGIDVGMRNECGAPVICCPTLFKPVRSVETGMHILESILNNTPNQTTDTPERVGG